MDDLAASAGGKTQKELLAVPIEFYMVLYQGMVP